MHNIKVNSFMPSSDMLKLLPRRGWAGLLFIHHCFITPLRVLQSTPNQCWRKAIRQTSQRRATLWAAGTRVPWRMEPSLTPMFPQVWARCTVRWRSASHRSHLCVTRKLVFRGYAHEIRLLLWRIWLWLWNVLSSAGARKKKQAKPLSFKVGMGKVIRGVSWGSSFSCTASKDLWLFSFPLTSVIITVGWRPADDE